MGLVLNAAPKKADLHFGHGRGFKSFFDPDRDQAQRPAEVVLRRCHVAVPLKQRGPVDHHVRHLAPVASTEGFGVAAQRLPIGQHAELVAKAQEVGEVRTAEVLCFIGKAQGDRLTGQGARRR